VTVYLTIRAAFAGDYNDDGIVDAADYVVWRKRLGTHIPLPNETASPGVVDEHDFNAWRENFGAMSGSSAADHSVPEPAASGLIMIAISAMRLIAARRRPNGG
jgi:hypothetical protein